jgi:prepilin-type N-terminal cleavage/methylation domain-containing protein
MEKHFFFAPLLTGQKMIAEKRSPELFSSLKQPGLRAKYHTGFTLLEVLIATTILVVIFGLATFMYVRAAKIRKEISYQNDIQLNLFTMLDEFSLGNRNSSGTESGFLLKNPEDPNEYNLHVETTSGSRFFKIAPGLAQEAPDSTGNDTTLWHSSNGTDWFSLDLNKKINLRPGSKFEYFNFRNEQVLLTDALFSETENYRYIPSLVKLTLIAGSNEPNARKKHPVTVVTFLRPRNILPF